MDRKLDLDRCGMSADYQMSIARAIGEAAPAVHSIVRRERRLTPEKERSTGWSEIRDLRDKTRHPEVSGDAVRLPTPPIAVGHSLPEGSIR